MANRLPLTANKEKKRIEELPSGDNLDLTQSGIVNATSIEANLFYGDLIGTAEVSKALTDAGNILDGTIDRDRLSGQYDIDITGTANKLERAENILEGVIDPARLEGTYNINISGSSQQINISDVSSDFNYYIPFVEDVGENQNLHINRDGSLSYNPFTKSLGINTPPVSDKILKVDGDVEFTSRVDALSYFGNGVNLSGIVTQITPGIGVRITASEDPGKGTVNIDAYHPIGKTIFVTQTGDDNNSGLTENDAKRTIKAAASLAVFGDTIKVYPGVYVEENPIILKKTVSVEGTELRNCVITPKYPYLDLFHVNNGCHITDVSFIGPEMTNGAAVVALQKLQGVSVDRFFDAARMIRYNLDYIANETVGFLTTTYSPFVGSASTYVSNIKRVWKSIIHDITRGGNSKTIEAGKYYYDESWNLKPEILSNSQEVQQTVAGINYSFNVARSVVNNSTWGGNPVGIATTVTNAVYNHITGVTSITALNHGLKKDDAVRIVGLAFTCPSGPGIVTYPSGVYGYIFNVLNSDPINHTFEVVVGQSTLPHTYSSGGTVQKYGNYSHSKTQVKDLSIQKDPLTGFNNSVNSCSNVISALHSCVGIVTNIVGLGSNAFNTVGIKTTFPGNSGIGFTTKVAITSAIYDEESGKTIITAPGHKFKKGEFIELRDLTFSCTSGGPTTLQKFPSGKYEYEFYIDKINLDNSIEVYVGTSTLPHTYVSGGYVVDRTVAVTTARYSHTTGITTIKALGSSIRTGDLITLRDLQFSCNSGVSTYPSGNEGYDFKVLDIVIDKPYSITTATYSHTSGIVTVTAPGSNFVYNDLVELRDLEFQCSSGAATTTIYPTGNNGYVFRVLSSIGSTFSLNVGTSTIPHTYVSGGYAKYRTLTANDEFTIQVGVATTSHTYVGGGLIIPSYSKGVGPITQGPYVRNATNFIPNSIGMKVEGFDAEPGDQDDIGVTGTMSVDSYTQYNQGGIGVSITNGAYCQLVSIFTICDDIAIYTDSGGQCDITNSNSSFGRLGLVSKGVGDSGTKSIYRYTGIANTTAEAEQDTIIVRNIGEYRPYDGQALYFGELFYSVQRIEVTDGGSGYITPPTITIESPPSGVNGITAEASVNIENGKVTSIDLISIGTQYRKAPVVTLTGGGGSGAKAKAIMTPIYYTIEKATLPSSGISTITLNTNLNSTVPEGTIVYFSRLSLQITSSHSFQWVGSGNNINTAKPALGGVVIPDNEVVKIDGGEVVYTSTDQAGNFRIGDGLVVNQLTGTVSGRSFSQSLINTVTPLIVALS